MTLETPAEMKDSFAGIDPGRLDAADDAFLDALPFAVVGLSADGIAEIYNAGATQYGGMKRDSVLGQPFFLVIGACMNNYLVAQRFLDEPVLDTTFDYILTFHMRPTPVKLRLLKRPGLRRAYLLIQR
jgi:photoactive yellow protein